MMICVYYVLYSGYVLFLEEDHYVSEDFLHVLNLLKAEREKRKEAADIICLGTYLKHAKSGTDTNWVRTNTMENIYLVGR